MANTYDERVRTSYWNATYHNASVREKKILAFLDRCEAECIPMDRSTAMAMSADDMFDFTKRFFAHSAEAVARRKVVEAIMQRHIMSMMEEISHAVPTQTVSIASTLRHGPCVRVGGWRYSIDAALLTSKL